MATYRAQDLANRITNTEPLFGADSHQEEFLAEALYAYNVVQSQTWVEARLGDATNVGNSFSIKNTFETTRYNLTRTGVQYNASLSFTPIGSYITFRTTFFDFPRNVSSFKIRVYKGRTQALAGVIAENKIPATSGYIPYSDEITLTEDSTRYTIYLNSLATSDLIARNGVFNFFILGEFDYNNIVPTQRIEVGGDSFIDWTLTVYD
jgi:hypothetical protein